MEQPFLLYSFFFQWFGKSMKCVTINHNCVIIKRAKLIKFAVLIHLQSKTNNDGYLKHKAENDLKISEIKDSAQTIT